MCSEFTSMEQHQYSEAICSSAFKLLPPSTSFLPHMHVGKPPGGRATLPPLSHLLLSYFWQNNQREFASFDRPTLLVWNQETEKVFLVVLSLFGPRSWGLFQSLVMSDPGCNNNLTPPIKTDQNFDIFHFHRTFPGAAIRRTELDQVISRPVKN